MPSATVLIVEDEDAVRMVACETLADEGYGVLEAGHAAAAIQHFEDGAEVHVLFTDIHMPGALDGLALARLVHNRWPQVRILVTSGQIEPSSADLPDMSAFLRKPYYAEHLLAKVRDLIGS